MSASGPADRAADDLSESPPERALIWLVCLTAALIPLNSTMIAVALPDVGGDLDATVRTTSWLVSAYLIVMAAVQPLGGKLGDRVGRRGVIAVGLAAFGAASLGAAAAGSIAVLVTLRVIQAVAGALMFPSAMALLREHLPERRRGRGLGMLSAAIGLAAAIGLPLGGALVALGGWRSIFLVNAPIVAVALVLALRTVPARKPATAGRFDAAGAVALFVLLTAAALAIGALGDLGAAPAAGIAAALAAGGWALVRHELRHPDPVLQPRLFARGAFAGATMAVGLSNLAMYGVLLAVPVLFTGRWSSFEVGAVLAAFSLSMVAAAPPGGRLADRLGTRALAAGGLTAFALGLIPLAIATDGISAWLMVLSLMVAGLGLGLANPAIQAAALNALAAREAGAGSGVFSTARYLGSILGASLLALLVGSSADGRFGVLLAICAGAAAAAALVSLRLPRGTPAGDAPEAQPGSHDLPPGRELAARRPAGT